MAGGRGEWDGRPASAEEDWRAGRSQGKNREKKKIFIKLPCCVLANLPGDASPFSGLRVALTRRCCITPFCPQSLRAPDSPGVACKKDAGAHLWLHLCFPGEWASHHEIRWRKRGWPRTGTLVPGSCPTWATDGTPRAGHTRAGSEGFALWFCHPPLAGGLGNDGQVGKIPAGGSPGARCTKQGARARKSNARERWMRCQGSSGTKH